MQASFHGISVPSQQFLAGHLWQSHAAHLCVCSTAGRWPACATEVTFWLATCGPEVALSAAYLWQSHAAHLRPSGGTKMAFRWAGYSTRHKMNGQSRPFHQSEMLIIATVCKAITAPLYRYIHAHNHSLNTVLS